jgi:hypothetical protein
MCGTDLTACIVPATDMGWHVMGTRPALSMALLQNSGLSSAVSALTTNTCTGSMQPGWQCTEMSDCEHRVWHTFF